MALSDHDRVAEVTAATDDVADLTRDVRVFASEAFDENSAVGAMWFRPCQRIVEDDHIGASLASEMNEEKHRAAHRIVVPAHPSDRVVFAGPLRHELEHARQFDTIGAVVFDIHDFIEERVLPEVAGGLDGCAGALINSIPTEMDCNAAASMYLQSRFPAADLDRIRATQRRYLVCSLLAPAPPLTLVVRMAAFAVVHSAAVEAHAARREFPVHTILQSVNGELARLWKEWGVTP